jgi:tetratricopeptide (TPR) repeat protein
MIGAWVGLVLAGPAWGQPAGEGDGEPAESAATSTTFVAAPAPTYRPALPAPVQLRTEVTAPAASGRAHTGVEELIERLETRASYLRKGNTASAEIELGQLFELRDALGAVNVPLASGLLVHESREALARGDTKVALATAEAAARLSPELVGAHWQRFQVATALEGRLDLAVSAARDALAARVRGFRNQVAALTDLLGIFVLTVLGVAALYALLQLVRYGRCAAADIADRLPGWAGMLVSSLMVLLVLFVPLAAGLGVATTVVVWLAASMLYQVTGERVVSMLLLVAVASLPLVMYAAAPLLLVHGSAVDDLAELASEAFAPEAEARLLAASAAGSRDYELSFLLGRRARAMGDLEGAERWYRAALEARPGDVAAKNNLGVILYLLRRPDAARIEWRDAGITRAEPVLNVSALDLEASRFEEANAGLARARAIDRARTERFSDSVGTTGERLLDVPFDQSALWTRLARAPAADASEVVQGLWTRVGGPLPWATFPVLALVLGVLGWLLGARAHAPFSTPCPKCGQPASRRAVDGYCSQCQTIFLKAVAVEPAMRLAKERAIRRHQGRVLWGERLLSLLAGAGHVLGGRPVEGLILLLAFVGVAVHWLWMDRLSVHPWATGLGLGTWHLGASVAVCGVLALIALRRTWAK